MYVYVYIYIYICIYTYIYIYIYIYIYTCTPSGDVFRALGRGIHNAEASRPAEVASSVLLWHPISDDF